MAFRQKHAISAGPNGTNERMDYVTHSEVRGINRLYDIAPRGSVIVALSPYMASQARGIEAYDLQPEEPLDLQQSTADRALVDRGDTSSLLRKMRNACPRSSYLLITREQLAEMELFSGVDPDATRRLRARVLADPHLRTIFAERDATIQILRGGCSPVVPDGRSR